MSENPSDVTIKLKRGSWEIEITTSEDKIKQVVESVLAGFSSAPTATQSLPEELPPKSTSTCRGLILNMWQEEWFTQERNLAEVHNELARRGYHYDRTAVSHSLTDLVRENILTRIGEARNYRYVQKKPPSENKPNSYAPSSST
ncbi:MAG: hypothetical protein HY619_00255 [Thaumarchaeota archaeon]|nr:hypothetical protein [Nitrososphaerota archaeon]